MIDDKIQITDAEVDSFYAKQAVSFDVSQIVHYAKVDENGLYRAWTYSLDALYKWQPHAMGQNRSFLLGGQLFWSDREYDPAPEYGVLPSTRFFGAFVFSQGQISRTTYLGLRYDHADAVDFPDAPFVAGTRRSIMPYLSWYTSEFLRLRLGYERWISSAPGEADRNTFLAELNFIFGAHPPEPFWVNR